VSVPPRDRDELLVRRGVGVRRRAFAILVRSYADAVGADGSALVLRRGGEVRLLAHWAREERELSVAWTRTSPIGRAFTAEGLVIERRAPTNGVLPPSELGDPVAAVAAPVRSAKEPLGALYATFSPQARVDEGEVRWTTESYARLAALAMAEDVTIAAVLGSSAFEPLTGCLSYGGLVEVLRAEIERSRRSRHRLSCCFIDLDGFKRVNDQRGHLEGNRVLAAVGAALQGSSRVYDSVGRFGGDEFVVICPETDGRRATAIASRMRDAVRRAVAERTTVPLDVSIGVADWDGQGTATELLEAADGALRDAKEAEAGAVGVSRSRPFARSARGRGQQPQPTRILRT
jgi:diguanylate cyclase (GGDEF)-like protein